MNRLLIASIALLAAGCGEPPTVEQRVIAEIREMKAEIEAGERLNFMSHVADDFRGQGEAMTREALRALIVLQLRRYENLQAHLLPITVREIGAREARADFRALLTGGAHWIPDDGQLYEITTHWRLDEGEWMLTAAYWDPVRLGEGL